jgi:hypothetical protein
MFVINLNQGNLIKFNAMRNYNPALENLMKFTPSDSIRTAPVSSYTAHNGWFEVNKVDGGAKNANKAKGAKS